MVVESIVDGSERRELKATAHHEAGHAVAAWYLGLLKSKSNSIRLTIKADDAAGSLGHFVGDRIPKWYSPDSKMTDRIRLRAERHIVVSLAGQLAEARFLGEQPEFGSDGDNKNAAMFASHLFTSDEVIDAYLRFCWCRAKELVEVRWQAIEIVASRLLERETLSMDDLTEAIAAARPRRPGTD
jgi:hypothetical protein